MEFDQARLDQFWKFVCERQSIWQRRFVDKAPPPWSKDLILQTERFTNIYRELDPGTQYAIKNILDVEATEKDKVFNIMLYRLIGRDTTHAAIGFQKLDKFDPTQMERVFKKVRVDGKPPFTAAYMVGGYTKMGSKDKATNIARIFGELAKNFGEFYERLKSAKSSEEAYNVLHSQYGFGDFLAYQVLVDLLYSDILPFSNDDWAKAGPGAKRGAKLLIKGPANELQVMRWLRDNQRSEFERLELDFPFWKEQPISLANIQNCLCEFHKYVKIKEGSGRGRRKFKSRS